MNKTKLTELEKKILFVIRTWQFEKLYSPTSVNVADIFGFGQSWAQYNINSLIRKGFLEWDPGLSRWRKSLKMPKGIQFPWHDETQFPSDVFNHREPHNYPSQLPSE